MIKYEITDPNGLLVGKVRLKEGESLPASATTSQIRAWLRFGQIAEVKATADKQEPENPQAPSTVEELKAALKELGEKIPNNATKGELTARYEKATADKQED
ncbi:MAG: hypothetical protein ACQKBY_06055 [Verrucomicrobiales bacterium]